MKARSFALLFAAVCLAAPAICQVAPPNSRMYGKSLDQWLSAYWQWSYGVGAGATVPYQPGPANVVFMPIPSGTLVGAGPPWHFRGSLDVTLKPGTGFVLPVFAWIIERYEGWPDVPDDQFIPWDILLSSVFYPGDPTRLPQILLDGKPILTSFWSYYCGPTMFPSPIAYAGPTSYGSVAALGYQGPGAVYLPLTPGTHTLTLLEELKIDFLGIDVIYDNTWIIHVVPPGKK